MTRFPVLEHHFPVLEHPFLLQSIVFCFRIHFPVLERHFPVLECPFLLCPVLSRVPSRFLAIPARPVPNFGCPGPSCPLARFWACPVVPLSRDNEGTSVSLSLCPGTKHFCLSRCPKKLHCPVPLETLVSNEMNGILFPKLFWTTVRKSCSIDQENFLDH